MGIKDLFSKIKPNFDFDKGWIPFLNVQAKWATAFFVRTLAIIISIALVLTILKKIEVVGTIRSLIVHDIMGIVSQGTDVVSSPDINYSKDLKSLDEIIKILESKKKIPDEENCISN